MLGEVAKNADDVSTETKLLENKNQVAGLLEDKTIPPSRQIEYKGGSDDGLDKLVDKNLNTLSNDNKADFVATSDGRVALADEKQWISTLKRDELLNQAENQQLKNLINQLYRPGANIGDGGSADSLRYELETGKLVGGRSHIIKVEERIRNLENIIKRQNLNERDLELANKLLRDLKNSQDGKR